MLIVMCGVSGSGKTTWANNYIIKQPVAWTCVSTDLIREELFGDASDQRSPQKVFNIAYGRLVRRLSLGQNVIFDATNLQRKYRIQLLQYLKKELGDQYDNTYKMIVVMDTSFKTSVARQELRKRRVPKGVIRRQATSLQYPTADEGWDRIVIKKEN